ncbi:MAG: alpha/beta fold hydrolase [Leptolyngbyaceae cyanobacterium SL_7_1]|nr:alpha/beta fold hydrolase [Leptolyngbyaceae cyanobacterium SL_7_1]
MQRRSIVTPIRRQFWSQFWSSWAVLLTALPSQAAERIYVRYQFVEFSISVTDLETFVATGEASDELDFYLDRLSAEQQSQIRQLLQARYEISPVAMARMSYSSAGDRLLSQMGELLQTPSGLNGWYAIRSALIRSTADPAGLTLINFLRYFPTDLRLNLAETLAFVSRATSLIGEIETTMTALQQLAERPSADTNPNPSPGDLRQAGASQGSRQTLTLVDGTRDRRLMVDLYLPAATPTPAPVLILSNGLGASRQRFVPLANHLMSHGFAVVVPDHPGSDAERQRAFYAGYYTEPFDAMEYIDRPLDITFVLDELDRRNPLEFDSQLNLQQVGILGYSFGGTTALSLLGATIDFQQLEQDCGSTPDVLNISILYQCRALELPRRPVDLQDNRIQAAFLFVPFGRSVFGQSGLSQVTRPVFWSATDADILTPLSIEQVPPFGWLASPDKYLVVADGLPHTRVVLQLMNRFMRQPLSGEEASLVTQQYLNALSVAFFKVYVAEEPGYRPYLEATHIHQLAEPAYPLSLVRQLPDRLVNNRQD